MDERTVLVSGASVAGLSAAYWLPRTGWQVTVIERSRAFRDGGHNVDIRGSAHEVIEKMGLTEAVHAATTTERGTRFVDEDGRTVTDFPVAGGDSLTAELEILRGDLARLILEALPESVDVRYGDQIEDIDPSGDGARVRLASGSTERYDAVVIAEGVRSRTRDHLFDGRIDRRPLGVNVVYGTIPHRDSDVDWWRWFTTTRGRQAAMRPDQYGTTRAGFTYKSDLDLAGIPVDTVKQLLDGVFRGAGGEADRILAEFAASGEVYVDHLTQIRMDTWAAGRVVVLGDAAWCVTPFCGGGTSLAVISGYVLAASLSQHPGDLQHGYAAFDAWMRPLVTKTQQLPPGAPWILYPRTKAGVAGFRLLTRVLGSKPARKLIPLSGSIAESGQPLPAVAPAAQPAAA